MARSSLQVPGVLAFLILLGPLLVWITPAAAAVIIVSTSLDEVVADGSCSLREAITNANANVQAATDCAGGVGHDLIAFAGHVTSAVLGINTDAGTQEDANVEGDLDLTDPAGLTIDVGHRVTVSAGPGFNERLLHRLDGPLVVTGITLTGGTADTAGGGSGNGGALATAGAAPVELLDVTISGNAASVDGGGLYLAGADTLLQRVTISNNIATRSGGGIATHGSLRVQSSSIVENRAREGTGGGVQVDGGDVHLIRTDVTNNWARAVTGNGGGIHLSPDVDSLVIDRNSTMFQNIAGDSGGAIWQGSGARVDLRRGIQIVGNYAWGRRATSGGGGIYNDGGTLRISGSDTQLVENMAPRGQGSGGAIFSAGGRVVITDANLHGNVANRAGGAIEVVDGRLLLRRATLDFNSATGGADGSGPSKGPGNGGAVHVSGAARVDIRDRTVVEHNRAAARGGGLWNADRARMTVRDSVVRGNDAIDGGGIWTDQQATLTVTRSTISDNVARESGGGIYDRGGNGTTLLVNTTISGNRAFRGAGIYDRASSGPFDLRNVTVSDNVGHGIAGAASITATSSIVANRPDGTQSPDCDAGLNPSSSGVLDSDGSCGGALTGDPVLAPLGGNGGPTPTHLPAVTSPAVMAGTSCEAVDQRGVVRPTDACTMGAVEVTAADAGPLMVTTTNDVLANDGACSLREAVTNANRDDQTWRDCQRGVGADTITFDGPSTVVLGRNIAPSAQEDDNGEGDLDAIDPDGLTIDGGGAVTITVDPGFNERILERHAGRLTISGLTLTGATADPAGGGDGNGGAIALRGPDEATLSNVTIDNNRATADGTGGGIFTAADLTTLNASSVTGNQAAEGGGIAAVVGRLVLTNGTLLTGNTATTGRGGGVYRATSPYPSFGVVQVDAGSQIIDNVAASSGGGIWAGADNAVQVTEAVVQGNTAGGGGGGITANSGFVSLTDSVVHGNRAGFSGGGVNGSFSRATVTRTTFTDNHAVGHGGGLTSGRATTIIDSHFAGNVAGPTASGGGGSIGTFSFVIGSTFTGNVAGRGGALSMLDGRMEISDTDLVGNTATAEGGGGLFVSDLPFGSVTTYTGGRIEGNVAEGPDGIGGGILLTRGGVDVSGTLIADNTATAAGGAIGMTDGDLFVSDTEIRDNSATGTGNGPGDGGGIYRVVATPTFITDGIMDVSDTLIAGNRAAGSGGGIWDGSDAGTTMTLERVQITDNIGRGGAGAFFATGAGDITIRDSHVTENHGTGLTGAIHVTAYDSVLGTILGPPQSPDCDGRLGAGSAGNTDSDGTCVG